MYDTYFTTAAELRDQFSRLLAECKKNKDDYFQLDKATMRGQSTRRSLTD